MATALTQTTLSAAVKVTDTIINVASATGIVAPTGGFMQQLYLINFGQKVGELMTVTAVSGTAISVARLDQWKQAFLSGAVVIIAPLVTPSVGPAFYEFNPTGAPTTNPALYTPWINVISGDQWLYSSLLNEWVPGFNNSIAEPAATAAVASVAGQITPTGPLFHVTGGLAITGIVLPVGFTGGSITIIPDGTFTWTTANNIALAGTAVVSKVLNFVYEQNAAKPWFPSYTS